MRALRSTTALIAIACSSARVEPPAPVAADPRASFRAYVDSAVGTPEFRSALWGVLIVDPARGETLYPQKARHHGRAGQAPTPRSTVARHPEGVPDDADPDTRR